MKNFNDIAYGVIGCCYQVYNNLGFGYAEKDYQKALVRELESNNFACEIEKSVNIEYKGEFLKNKRMDILVNNELILELKIFGYVTQSHISQLSSYLKASNKRLGLIVLFNKGGVIIKRVVN